MVEGKNRKEGEEVKRGEGRETRWSRPRVGKQKKERKRERKSDKNMNRYK